LETLEWLRGRPENNVAAWVELLALVGLSPALADRVEEIAMDTLALLHERPGEYRGIWVGLITVLATCSTSIEPGRRTEILDSLRQWSARYLEAGNSYARGIEILVLADSQQGEVALEVEERLAYVETQATPALAVVYPLAHLIGRTRNAELSARMNAWVREYLDEHGSDWSNSYRSLIALVPQIIAKSAE
jgi:hypothetical protein